MRKLLLLFGVAGLSIGCAKRVVSDLTLEPAPIVLHSGIKGTVSSKAPVVQGAQFPVQICGWQHSSAVEWSSTPTWISTSQMNVSMTVSEIILNPVRTYNEDGLTTTLCAWHPIGTVQSGRVSFVNKTGEIDVMMTQSVSGTSNNPIESILLFEHLTTQLRFVVVGQDWFADENIVSVSLRSVAVPVGIDMGARSLVGFEVASLPVPGIASLGVYPAVEAVDLGSPIMLTPIAQNKIFIDVTTTSKAYPSIEVTTTDSRFMAGKAYTVTLTFSGAKGITVGSTVNEWAEGVGGSEIVD